MSVLIWTTTPWTIPDNLAIAFHPDFEYGAYDVNGTAVIVATDLAAAVAAKTGRAFDTLLATFPGTAMERLVFRHPLYARDSLGVLGDYVTLEAGTGAVHTAPGHGADDYATGVKYGLEIYAPLDAAGRYNDTVERFAGLQVWEANPKVEAALAEARPAVASRGLLALVPALLALPQPGDLPGHGAVVHRHGGARTCGRAPSQAIADTRWIPSWGRARIEGMIANRPDWCISRQRAWGVPIPALDCTACGTAVLTAALVEQAATVFDTYGADAWYERPLEEFVPAGLACPSCGGTSFEREANILDVWFDSGSSHEAVLPFREDHRWPADLYLEGSDQHRGWFHSSLLVGIGTRGRAPFDQVLTHGFVMAEDGRKMSKSLGNSIAPQDVIKQSGAEVLRLWASMVDYREDIRIGKEILTRTVEAYRKIRNVLRVLVANLYDFDPADESVPVAKMEEIDRWLLARYAECATRIVKAYDDYDYPTVFQTRQPVHHRGRQRVLRRRDQGPDVHLRRLVRGAAVGPDGDVRRRRRPGAAARADPVGDDGRAVARPAGRARGVGAHGAVPARPRRLRRSGPGRALGRARRGARRGQRRRSNRSARTRRSAATCRPPSRWRRRAPSWTCCGATRRSCRRSSACRRCTLRRRGRRRPRGRRSTRAEGVKCDRCWRVRARGEQRARSLGAVSRAASTRWPKR